MIVENKIRLDMSKKQHPVVVDAVQGDSNTRVIVASLYANSVPWTPASGATLSLAYKKPDGTSGWYDTMPDGSTAISVEENVVTVKLVSQVLSVAGTVDCFVRVQNGADNISTFPFVVNVEANPTINSTKSENYYNVQTWEDVNTKLVGIFEQEFADDQKEQARANINAAPNTSEYSEDVLIDIPVAPFVIYENAYSNIDGDYVEKAGCSVYRIYLGDENKELFGKTLKIKTYAYREMAYGFEGEPGTLIKPDADVTGNPASGVCEFYVTLPNVDPETANLFFHVSYAENTYTDFEVYEVKKATVWDEIKKLKDSNAVLYTPQSITPAQQAQARENIGFTDALHAVVDKPLNELKQRSEEMESSSTIVCEEIGSIISVADSSDRKLLGLNLYGKTTQDGTPTLDAPVELVNAGSDGEITATITGKNIFGGKALVDAYVAETGKTNHVDNPLGTIDFGGSIINKVFLVKDFMFKPNTQYSFVFYGYKSSGTNANLSIRYTDGSSTAIFFSEITTPTCYIYTTPKDKTVKGLQGTSYTGTTYLYYDKCGIFEGVLTEKDFEPYIAQQLIASTPNGLRSVGSVKDEIDFARGVRVTRIGVIDSYEGEEITTEFVSSTGELSEGAMVQYVLDEPLAELLTEEELVSYSALHTNKPNTTIYNDGGAGMAVEYVADTKLYIDNKFTQLQNAILSAGANV